MTRDRIKDLQKTPSWPRVSYQRLSRQVRNHDTQVGNATTDTQFTTIEVDSEHNVAEFLAQMDLILLLIDKIEELVNEIKVIHKKMLEPTADPKLRQEVDNKTADIKRLAYDVSTKLKKIKQEQDNKDELERARAQYRIQASQIYNLTQRFREVMNQNNQESVSHRERCKKVIVRELEITGVRKSDKELEEMLEHGFPGTFSHFIMVDVEKMKQAANEIDARHRDITKIEASIKELHDMFADLAVLVATQGDMIDNIEHNVSKAVDYVNSAVVEVEKAEKDAEAAAKKKLIVGVVLIVIVLVIIFILAVYFTVQKKFLGR